MKPEAIAREILSQLRTTIVMDMRFLDMALFRLTPAPSRLSLATDGQRLYYEPQWLMGRYRAEPEAAARDYLHVLLHCVFRHPFAGARVDWALWDLACDIAVEGLISAFSLPHFRVRAEQDRREVLDALRRAVTPLTAEKLYSHFRAHPPESGWAKLFYADDHRLWRVPSAAPNAVRPPSDPDDRGAPGPGSGVEDEWRSIGEHIQMALAAFGKKRGDAPGDLLMQLTYLNREKYDYEAFLRKFAVLGEVMKLDDDGFDQIFYTYGLSLYKNMPLIEPLEYKEVKRIRDFVIAIDTSGSTSGDLVRRFLNKTFNILMNAESFFTKVNIYIVQCDAAIQEVIKITDRAEFEDCLRNMTIRGLGGTDFRPVFEYVDALVRQGAFQRLKGLIYFTDGCGVYPARRPDYQAAFVFVQDEYNDLSVPPWAIRLILDKEDL